MLATLAAVPAFVLAPASSHAQVDQGSISGSVIDPSGAVIPSAKLTLVNRDNNFTLQRTSTDAGKYTFAPIKVGVYTLRVEAPGFSTTVREGIRVDVSSKVGLDIKLVPGAVDQTVEVTATAQIQTEDAATGQVFGQKELDSAPLLNRNYLFLAQLTTGVTPPNQGNTQTSGTGAFSSNGSRVSQNNFILDGVDNNSNMQDYLNGATFSVLPPPDALTEVRVETSNYSAELGRGTGAAVNAAIKSGTNNVHGSLWEYFRSDRLAATDYFNTSRTAYHYNVFGATLGGPILRNKLFIFADAQGTRISQYSPAQINNTVPTDLMRNGDFSEMLDPNNTVLNGSIALYKAGGNLTPTPGAAETAKDPSRYLSCSSATAFYPTAIPGQNVICPSSVNSIAQRILKLFPEPNQGLAHQVFNNYTIPATANTSNITQYDVRADWNISSKDQAFARYSYANNPSNYAPPLGILDGGGFGSDGQNSNYSKSGVVSETHIFSPTLSNEFRVGYNWLHASYLQVGSNTNVAAQYGLGGIPYAPTLGGFPDISFGGYINSIGIPSYMPSDELQNVIQFLDNVSKVVGPHTLKAGVAIQHTRFYGLQSPNPTGSLGFYGVYTGDPGDFTNVTGSGVADFELDQMNSSSINSDTPFTDVRYYNSAYVQDDWKVNRKLTLNLGLRWEYTQPFEEVHDQQANFIGNYAGMNQGSGTFLIPESQKNYPIPATIAALFAKDNITVKYTGNRSLMNPNYHEFAPRFGFAYQPREGLVLRGGFGLFYGGQENIGLGLNLFNNPPFFLSSTYNPTPNQCYNTPSTGVVCPTNGQTLETGFGSAITTVGGLGANANLPTLFQQDQNASSSYSEAYNVSMQQALSSTTSFTISYQGNQSKRLRVSYGANQYPGVVPSGANAQLYQPFYDFGNILRVTNEGSGNYNSLQAKIERRFSNGLAFLAGYTWAHSLDDAVQPIQGNGGQTAGNPAFLGLRFQYGASITDVRNRFTFNSTYELPFGRGKAFLSHNALLDEVAGGWKLSGIFQVQGGEPIAFSGLFRKGDPFAPGGTPDPVTQHQVTCATQTRTLAHWFNPCAFTQAPVAILPGTQVSQDEYYVLLSQAGTLPYGQGRLTVAGPGFNRVDLSLFKDFTLFRESRFELRADGFNVLNTPAFGDPNNSIKTASAGSITHTRYSSILPSARVIQVAGRFIF